MKSPIPDSDPASMERGVLIIGTLDTKGEELLFLRDEIRKNGLHPLLVDVGVFESRRAVPDIANRTVVNEAGHDLDRALASGDRRKVIKVMTEGACALVSNLYAGKKFQAVLGVGGGTGTHIITQAMKTLPFGVPKLMVSTVASRDMRHVIGTKDITIMHSVVDMLGLNAASRTLLSNAAGAIAGMVRNHRPLNPRKRLIGLTVFGFCTEGGMHAKKFIEQFGYEMVAFHANGTGGMAMEDLAEQGIFSGILDFATHEFADQLYGGYCSGIGPKRMETAAQKGIPLVIVPGGLDCIVLEFDSPEKVPDRFKGRKIFWYDFRSGVRTNRNELGLIAQTFAEKLAQAKGPVKVLIPLLGWSEADKRGGPLYEPETNAFFLEKLKERLAKGIEIVEIEAHINDPIFSQRAVETLHQMMGGS